MPSPRWPAEARLGAACLLVAGAASLPYPVLGAPIDYLDDSWELGLYLAHGLGLHWGTQIIWTYGPLGWLLTGHPADGPPPVPPRPGHPCLGRPAGVALAARDRGPGAGGAAACGRCSRTIA